MCVTVCVCDCVCDYLYTGQLALPQSREAVLDYIVERKRMDDLASSITDGRFREQKVHKNVAVLSSFLTLSPICKCV